MTFFEQCMSCPLGVACLIFMAMALPMIIINFGKFPKISMMWQGVFGGALMTALFAVPLQASEPGFDYPPQQTEKAVLVSGVETD